MGAVRLGMRQLLNCVPVYYYYYYYYYYFQKYSIDVLSLGQTSSWELIKITSNSVFNVFLIGECEAVTYFFSFSGHCVANCLLF